MTDDGRDDFLRTVRDALGREPDAGPGQVPTDTGLSRDPAAVEEEASSIRLGMSASASELFDALRTSAIESGWTVQVCSDAGAAGTYVASLARDLEASSVMRSTHPVLDTLNLKKRFRGTGIELETVAIDDTDGDVDGQRPSFRAKMIEADIGVTGVDYAIAETGSCVVVARKGESRLVSLLPPIHVAVVTKGQVLPSLDELFTLRRADFIANGYERYMNVITGPSRSADIEQTIVKGVHGPREVHLVMVG